MITTLDLSIIIGYLIAVFGIATFFSIGQGLEGFLVNSRATRLPFLVVSIVSTTVGAGFFLSVAAEGYESGISFGFTMIMVSIAASLTLAAISRKIKYLSDNDNSSTVPEFLSIRYQSRTVGFVAALITVFGYLFVTALQFVGIGAIGSVISGYDFKIILIIAGITTIAYTAIGGLRSNLFADALSFLIMVIVLVIIITLIITSEEIDLSKLPPTHLDVFAFSGVPFFFLSILLSIVSAFMFMELWQRIFSAKDYKVAQCAFLISAVLQPPLIGSGIILGLVASILYKDIDKSAGLFQVMVDFLPSGILGFGLVAVLAILMSTVNSLVLVGGSALFTNMLTTNNLYQNGDVRLRWVRFLTIAFGACALCLAFLLPDLVRLLLMGAFIMMPMCPAIIWTLFAKKLHPKSSIASMISGISVTIVLIPWMPDTAFAPGFLVSLLILVVAHLALRKK
uniref:Na+/proline symporter n=1 Tax=Candidatus Kentrum sp. LFY TaxID=2126342 RepID=A0A450U5F6_9GAMM|nr:MAG: Na+/proline symporter [Candidatus Kentron sp. LFY]